MLFVRLWNYSHLMFVIVISFILLQIYFSLRFAQLSKLVDDKAAIIHPIAFECFPFVVYNMYSGKLKDWGNYEYLKLAVNNNPIALTSLSVIQEEQISNPLSKYLETSTAHFQDLYLHQYLQKCFDSSELSEKIYNRIANQNVDSQAWSQWLTRYLTTATSQNIQSLKISRYKYQYNSTGRPEPLEESVIYTYGK